MSKQTEHIRHYTLGHVNFGMLTTHVPGSNYRIYTDRAQAETDCEQIHKRNHQMKVLVCTRFGTPVRIAKRGD